jgi:hypothetical protein
MNRFSEAIESGERNDGFERGFEKYLGQSRELDPRKLRATAFYLLTLALMGDLYNYARRADCRGTERKERNHLLNLLTGCRPC